MKEGRKGIERAVRESAPIRKTLNPFRDAAKTVLSSSSLPIPIAVAPAVFAERLGSHIQQFRV
jgi:hypothetical protein